MKRAIFAIMMAAGLALNTGCQTIGNGCSSCGGGCESGACQQAGPAQCEGCESGCESCQSNGAHPRMAALKRHLHGDPEWMNAGPPSPAITYPYYTTRGPRDFFEKSPSSIGR